MYILSPDGASNTGKDKALNVMASEKITQIQNGDRMLEINVKEKTSTKVIESRLIAGYQEFVKNEVTVNDVPKNHNELRSLTTVVSNPVTSYCLKQFMKGNYTINNLNFWLRTSDWKRQVQTGFLGICKDFIDDDAHEQVCNFFFV